LIGLFGAHVFSWNAEPNAERKSLLGMHSATVAPVARKAKAQ